MAVVRKGLYCDGYTNMCEGPVTQLCVVCLFGLYSSNPPPTVVRASDECKMSVSCEISSKLTPEDKPQITTKSLTRSLVSPITTEP